MKIPELEKKAKQLRLAVVRMIGEGQKGHLGGSCSIADIVTALYYWKMRHRPADPRWEDRDRLILSKGHAALIQYAALSDLGYFPTSELERLKQFGASLQGHPDMLKTPGIEANTGSLGQGLSIACGMAAGMRIDGSSGHVYVVVGDGEMAEGQIWESAMAARFHRLGNLTAIIDLNRMQATGLTEENFDTRPVRDKWIAMGWKTWELDGHDMISIVDTLKSTDAETEMPKALIANTTKGKGVSFAENNPDFHHGLMTRDQYQQACRELT